MTLWRILYKRQLLDRESAWNGNEERGSCQYTDRGSCRDPERLDRGGKKNGGSQIPNQESGRIERWWRVCAGAHLAR